MKPVNQPSTGFTLLELMIVVTIVSLVTAIGVPAMKGMAKNSTAKRIAGLVELDLKFARSSAISMAQRIEILPVDSDSKNGWQVRIESTKEVLKQRGELPDGVTLTAAGAMPIVFTPTGQVEAKTTLTLRTSGCTGDEDKLYTLLASGQLTTKELACITK